MTFLNKAIMLPSEYAIHFNELVSGYFTYVKCLDTIVDFSAGQIGGRGTKKGYPRTFGLVSCRE